MVPAECNKETPRKETIVPSVAMNGGIARKATKKPFKSPKSVAITIISRTPKTGFPPDVINSKAMTELKARMDPTDKSIPAAVITKVIPTAMMMNGDACVRTLRKFSSTKKRGFTKEKTTISKAKNIVIPRP